MEVSVRATRQRPQKYSGIVSLGKPKYILKDKLIKYNLSLEKLKRTRWDFPRIVAILNTLWFIAI